MLGGVRLVDVLHVHDSRDLRQTAAAPPRHAGGLVNLLVIRHAVAEDRESFAEQGKDDSLRPLTEDGRRKMQRATRGIQWMVPSVGVIATSPFVRATQTAQVVGKLYRSAAIVPVDALIPDAEPRDFLAWLDSQEIVAPVAAVGHEPHLGSLVWWLLNGERTEERIQLANEHRHHGDLRVHRPPAAQHLPLRAMHSSWRRVT